MNDVSALDLSRYQQIVVLTGAGVSAASGLKTYRGPGGVWEEYDVEEYGHVDRLQDKPEKLWTLFGELKNEILKARPNRAHELLALVEKKAAGQFTLITQNVDGLHQQAGSVNVIELHGSTFQTRCTNEQCEASSKGSADHKPYQYKVPMCDLCGALRRPDVVFFGEQIPALADWQSKRALRDCDLFLAVGTSGCVAPASNFVRSAKYAGARTILVSLDMDKPHPDFDEVYTEDAAIMLAKLLGV